MSYQDVKDKLYRGHRKIANNTYLTLHKGDDSYPYPEAIKMKLHGNTVAIFTQEFLELFSAGWYTQTTKERLNLALDLAGIDGCGVWQHDCQWYFCYLLTGVKFCDGIKIDYAGEVIN